jgi:hypothetical protein
MSDFYIGYEPKAPPRLAQRTKWVVRTLAVGTLMIALGLVAAQNPFDNARFEYGVFRPYTGHVMEWPAPMLVTDQGAFLLVAPGKHGAADLVRGHEGETLAANASLIERAEGRMLELQPQSMHFELGSQQEPARIELGSFTFTGEIVDTKCFLGVMNPGRGKVHRDCAARCISSGIPPALLVHDASGGGRILVLRGADGREIGHEVLHIVGEPVTATGRLLRVGAQLVFQADPDAFRRE